MATVVKLRVSNHKAYVWDVEDLNVLRSQYRICGLLIGTLPHMAQQNVFLGVPLVLMPEEVVLLVTKGFAVLIDDPSAHHTPSPKELQKWREARDREQKASTSRMEESQQLTSANKAMSEEAVRKRQQREEKRAAERAKRLEDLQAGHNSIDTILDRPTTPVAESVATTVAAPTYSVTIPTPSEQVSWYAPTEHCYSTITAAKEAGIWSYPADVHERAKCGVFQYLWEKNYYLGGGLRFGGDYLVYPGDPLRYHSHFVASVIDSPTSTITPMEIVAHGRLGTGTKKSHLLCGWDDATGAVSCHSIEWAGFG